MINCFIFLEKIYKSALLILEVEDVVYCDFDLCMVST
jgi:hypothetical protein